MKFRTGILENITKKKKTICSWMKQVRNRGEEEGPFPFCGIPCTANRKERNRNRVRGEDQVPFFKRPKMTKVVLGTSE